MGYELKGEVLLAIDNYNKALSEAVFDINKAWILFSLGNLSMNSSNEAEALNYYNLSLSYYNNLDSKSDKDFVCIADIYNEFGIIERTKGNYDDAIKNHKKALEIRKSLSQTDYANYIFDVSMSYNNLALIYKYINKLDLAEEYNIKSLDIRKKLYKLNKNDYYLFFITRSLNNLSNIYDAKSEFLKARKTIEEAIELFLKLRLKIKIEDYQSNLASYYVNYARILHSLNEYKKSAVIIKKGQSYYKDLIKINRDEYIENYVGITLNLARLLRDIGEINQAKQSFEEALKTQTEISKVSKSSIDSQNNLADIYFNIGILYMEKKPNKELALFNFNKAFSIYNRFPQSAHSKKWAEAALKRIEYLEDI